MIQFRVRYAEGLQAFADALCSFSSGLNTLLQSDSSAELICPLGIFESDGLDAFNDLVGVDTLGVVKQSG